MDMKYNYLVVYDTNGEKGWSGENSHYETFEILESATKFYKELIIEDYDWSVIYKQIYKIEKVKIDK